MGLHTYQVPTKVRKKVSVDRYYHNTSTLTLYILMYENMYHKLLYLLWFDTIWCALRFVCEANRGAVGLSQDKVDSLLLRSVNGCVFWFSKGITMRLYFCCLQQVAKQNVQHYEW